MSNPSTTIYHVGGARDARHVHLRPACVVVAHGRIAQVSRPEQINTHDFPDARHIHAPDMLVLPRMVNAHAHLDMTTIGPRPYQGQFDQWLTSVIHDCPDASAAPASVTQGWRMSIEAGVGLVGDIARHASSVHALASCSGPGQAVSFLECFGHDAAAADCIAQVESQVEALLPLQTETSLRLGLQPHAPYSAGLKLYMHAAAMHARHRVMLSTHLAETLEEDQFIRHGQGMFAQMLRKMNKWDDATMRPRDVSTVQYLAPTLHEARWLVAHCNYLSDQDIAILARNETSVAYCPIASHYFGHRGHRWKDLLAAGVNVCLGTDSILCQPPDEKQPMGIMAQMRHLFRHDDASPEVLLAMATTHGSRALDADEALVTLQPDSPADIMAVRFDPANTDDPLAQALADDEPLVPLANIKTTSF